MALSVRPSPPQLTQVTADDVIASGACSEGVFDWLRRQDAPKTLGSVRELLQSDPCDRAYIKRAGGLTGYGNGYGNGYGYGYGDGRGDGYGDGYGYGDGDGDGDGDGSGDGYGYGYGDGYGNGNCRTD